MFSVDNDELASRNFLIQILDMKKKLLVLVLSIIAIAIGTVFLVHFYDVNQAQEQPSAQKQEQPQTREQYMQHEPFWQVIGFAETESENLLIKKGLIPQPPPPPRPADLDPSIAWSPPPPVACNLDTCADVRKYSIADDGSMQIVLSGTTQPDLEGKLVVLSPIIAKGKVKWKCQTNAPKELVPTKEELHGWGGLLSTSMIESRAGFCFPSNRYLDCLSVNFRFWPLCEFTVEPVRDHSQNLVFFKSPNMDTLSVSMGNRRFWWQAAYQVCGFGMPPMSGIALISAG